MCWFGDVEEILGVFAPLLIEFPFDVQHTASSLGTPFVVELSFDRARQLNQIDLLRSKHS
jgi:hypothetical protein